MDVHAAQSSAGVSDDPPVGGVCPKDIAIKIDHRDTDRSILEGRKEPFMSFPERFVGLLAFGDVVEIAHNPAHLGVVEVVRDGGLEPPPGSIPMAQPEIGMHSVAPGPGDLVRARAQSGEVIRMHDVGRGPRPHRVGGVAEQSIEGWTHVAKSVRVVGDDNDVARFLHQRLEAALAGLASNGEPLQEHDGHHRSERVESSQRMDKRLVYQRRCEARGNRSFSQPDADQGPDDRWSGGR